VRLAIIEERQVTQYLLASGHHLLASGHPAARGKAIFFERFGFRPEVWQSLRSALLDHARSARVVAVNETEFGKKYTMDGPLIAPDGRTPRV
jgi:hypothetical protein